MCMRRIEKNLKKALIEDGPLAQALFEYEDARNLLKKLWQDAYLENLQILIPDMARQLDAGYLFAAGVKLSTV